MGNICLTEDNPSRRSIRFLFGKTDGSTVPERANPSQSCPHGHPRDLIPHIIRGALRQWRGCAAIRPFPPAFCCSFVGFLPLNDRLICTLKGPAHSGRTEKIVPPSSVGREYCLTEKPSGRPGDSRAAAFFLTTRMVIPARSSPHSRSEHAIFCATKGNLSFSSNCNKSIIFSKVSRRPTKFSGTCASPPKKNLQPHSLAIT